MFGHMACFHGVERSFQFFLSLIPPSPSAPTPPPPSAYLYLAQITDDDPKTALAYYQNAIDVQLTQLKGKERATQDNVNDENELKNNIVRTFVGMVEIWMDPSYDLWYEITTPHIPLFISLEFSALTPPPKEAAKNSLTKPSNYPLKTPKPSNPSHPSVSLSPDRTKPKKPSRSPTSHGKTSTPQIPPCHLYRLV